jgi:hypothetical protein
MSISPQWTIVGEAGKRLDATSRTFADLNAYGLLIDFPDLAVDTAKFSIRLADLVPSGTELFPEEGQKVTIYRSGTRFFQGRCTVCEQDNWLIHIVISGVGWDLDQEPFTSVQTDSISATAERLSYAFAAQSLTTSLSTIIATAATAGVGIAVGSLATTFSSPQISLKQMSCGQAAADIIRLTPDVMAWIDYSPATPTYNTARRKTATVRSLAAGDLLSIRLRKETTLKVDHIKVAYVTRGTDGRRVFAEQVSGDAGTAQAGSTNTTIKLRSGAAVNNGSYVGADVVILTGAGSGQTRTISAYNGTTKVATVSAAWTTTPNNTSTYQIGGGLGTTGTRQVHVVSGEEMDTFLPNDYFDSVQVQTIAATGDLTAAVKALDSGIKALITQYGSIGGGQATGITYYTGFSNSKTQSGSSYAPPLFKVNNVAVSVTGKYIVTVGELPDWLVKSSGAVKADMSCTYVASIVGKSGSTTFPDWFIALGSRNIDKKGQTGAYADSTTTGTTATDQIWWCAVPISVSVWLIPTAYATLTTVYRPADYSFIYPPAGFASGMQESNGFDVYSGDLSFKTSVPGGTRYRGCTINLTGHRSEFATMAAMVRGETLDVDSGTTTLRLGAPPRFTYRAFMDRIRSRASDNVAYIF